MSTSKVEYFPLLGAGLQKVSTTAESIAAATLDPTGFEDPDNVGISYSHTDRKITLTHSSGTIAWWYRGTRYTTASPWTSAAHDAPVGSYWLTFAGAIGTASWAGSVWTFDKVQVAYANYQTLAVDSFALRETHGLMPWQAHENDHLAIGTYKKSGLSLTAGTYALNGTTDAENSWGCDSGVIQDEDLESAIGTWTEGTYTVLYRNGVNGTWVFDTTKTLPFHVATNTIQYNQLTGGAWQLSPVTEDNFVNYYVVAVPVTSDADSQKHRIWVIPGQSIYTSSTAAQQEFPTNLDLGTLTSLAAEFVFCVRVTMRYNASGAGALGTTGRCNIAAVANLTGTRLSQVASAPFSPADHGSLSGLGDDDHTQYELITGRATNVVTKNTDFTIDSGVILYCVDTSGGNKTVTLLDPTTVPGKLVTFINTSTNNIIFDSYAIGGLTNFTIDGNERLQIVSDGTAWKQYARKMMATWKTGITFCKDHIVEVSESGYEGIWRCITQHTAAAAFATDVEANWDYMGGSRSAMWINSNAHGFVEGDWLYDTGAAWGKADCDAAATAETVGVVSRATTNYFLLVTNGYMKRSSNVYTRGALQYLSGTAGASTETEPSTVGQISKQLGVAISTSELMVSIQRSIPVLVTTNFNGSLSAAETTQQLVNERLDDFNALFDWATSKAYRVGNVVKITDAMLAGFAGEWKCISAHTSGTLATDIASKWELIAAEGSRELVDFGSAHGFAIGDVLYSNAGVYTKAKADVAATAEVVGMVAGTNSANHFILAKTGKVTKTGWARTAGAVYFLDASTEGAITATEPSTVGQISKPIGIAVSATEIQLFNMRGTTVGGTNLYTTISLANNATTTIQDVSGHTAGTGGYIEGYIKIDGGAGEDAVTTFKVEFQKPASGTAYSRTVTYGCEALFAGSSIDITTGGLIQVTLADVGGDFVSASATFCMQAAAIGAQLPLQINSSSITYSEPLMFRNMLINGCMRVVQRGTSFDSTTLYPNNDATYLLDRWYILSDGNDVVDVTQQTDAPSLIATSKCIRLDVETANKKFGIAQIIEADSCSHIIGGSVTLSFYAKVSATTNLDNVKCAIISWSGTADSVTSDIVSAWEIEGTNPTLIANATYENTPANLGVTTSWARYTVTAAVDTASTKQLVLFIWSDVTTTSAGEFLYITGAQLEKGTSVTPFEFRPFSTELALCQRYFEKSYAASVTPGTSTTAGATALEVLADGNLTRLKLFRSGFAVHKRVSPDIKWYSETGTADSISVYSDRATTKTVSSTTGTINSSVGYFVTVSTNAVAAQTYVGHWTASAEL